MFVYNEEKRIEATLRSAAWCDEIIVFDRNSSDRTREIAAKYTDKIITLPNREYSPRDNEIWPPYVKCEWVLGLTASDILHPELARRLRELTDKPDFPYDVIDVPFHRYVLGLETPRSPWYSEANPSILFRKRIMRVDPGSVHGAIVLDSSRHYKIRGADEACMYHLTHSTVDLMMDRHILYFQADARIFSRDTSLKIVLVDIFRAFYVVLFKRRTLLMGWDGVALAMAYLSYWMLRFVYIWEKRYSKAPETYTMIKQSIEEAWGNLPTQNK